MVIKPEEVDSKYLSKKEIKGLLKIGDILIPRNPPFPSFSDVGCILYVDDAVSELDPQDLSDLKMFLGIAASLPKFLLRFVIKLLNIGGLTLFRMGNLGIRGVIFSLYYSNKTAPRFSGKKPFDVIGYKVNIVPIEQK